MLIFLFQKVRKCPKGDCRDKNSGVGRENEKKDVGNTDKVFDSLAFPAEPQSPLGV